MKNNILSVFAILIALSVGVKDWFIPKPKVGFVETSVLLTQFSEALKAKNQFEESKKEWEKNLLILNDSLMNYMDYMKNHYEQATPETQRQMKAELEKRNENYGKYQEIVKKNAQEKEQELMQPVIQKVNSFLKDWGEANNFDLIFGTMSGGNILYGKDILNVTPEILKDLNIYYQDKLLKK